VYLLAGDTLAEGYEQSVYDADPEDARSDEFRSFLGYVMRRRLSKEGRFLRVYFKNGSRVSLVPEGSLASGMRLAKDRDGVTRDPWDFVWTDMKKLWEEFRAANDNRRARGKAEAGRPRVG
jgi:hypothetical protein